MSEANRSVKGPVKKKKVVRSSGPKWVKPVKKTPAEYHVVVVPYGKDPVLKSYETEEQLFKFMATRVGSSDCLFPYRGQTYDLHGDQLGRLYVSDGDGDPRLIGPAVPETQPSKLQDNYMSWL